jgi:hypothetical protein
MFDNVTTLPRCQATKNDGTPCERIVGGDQRYCYSHDSSRAKERSANASKAARSKPQAEVTEIKQEIRTIMRDIREGELDRGDGAVLLQGAGQFLKAVQVSMKVREQEDLEVRLEELEAVLDRRKKESA